MALLKLLRILSIVCVSLASLGQSMHSFQVIENGEETLFVGRVHTDGSLQEEYSFGGPTVDKNRCNTYFLIDSTTSSITTNGTIDREEIYEEIHTDSLTCYVCYNERSGCERIDITILDVNDETPYFFELSQPEHRTIAENVAVPTPVLRLEPVDNDKGENGTIEFNIINGNDDNYFVIRRALGDNLESTTWILCLVKELDFDQGQAPRFFNLTIEIFDMGEPQLSFEQIIMINVLDLQDEPPTFPVTSVSLLIPENHPIGSQYPFASITASNSAQVQGDIFYSLSSENTDLSSENTDSADMKAYVNSTIGVNAVTGEIFLKRPLDFDGNAADPLTIRFYLESFNPSINDGDNVHIMLTIEDVNDETPVLDKCTLSFNGKPCLSGPTVEIMEHLDSTFEIWLYVSDRDINQTNKDLSVNESIVTSSDPTVTGLNIRTLNFDTFFSLIVVSITQSLNREMTPNFTLSINFSNSAVPYLTGSTTVHVNVLDINDNSPQFIQPTYSIRVAEGAPLGKDVLTVVAHDEDKGENGVIRYLIQSVDNPEAQEWFSLSPTTGTLNVASVYINYNTVGGRVLLTVTAMDGGNSSLSDSATIDIEISPTITFPPNSYVRYDQIDIVHSEDYSIYLELRTKSRQGILFFQQGDSSEDMVLLEIKRGLLRYQHGSNLSVGSDILVNDNKLYSVWIERQKEGANLRLNVSETELQVEFVARTLLDASLERYGIGNTQLTMSVQFNKWCNDNEQGVPTVANSLYIGGVDLFSLDRDVQISSTEFIGTIRSVLINNTQIDLGCPTSEVNVIQGFYSSDGCAEQQVSCINSHTTTCIDYAPEPYCKCLGGFPPLSCQPIPNPDPNIKGGEDSYAPIRFHGNSKVDLILDYAFFSDLELQRRQAMSTTASPDPERKKREVSSPSSATVQTLELSFRPVDVSNSVLLHSQTPTFNHTLQIIEAAGNHAIKYTAVHKERNQTPVHIVQQTLIQNMTSYNVTLTTSQDMVTLSVKSADGLVSKSLNRDGHDFSNFVQQPSTILSIGGAPHPKQGQGYFQGCISRIAIDGIEIPLTGLLSLSSEDGGFITGEAASKPPQMYCDLCDLTPCQANAMCVKNVIGEPSCECQDGTIPVGAQCQEIPPVIVTGTVGPESNDNTIKIAGGAVGLVTLLLLIVMIVVCTRVCHKKRDRQKRTYSVSSMNIDVPSGISSRPNPYVHVPPRGDDLVSAITSTNARLDRGSSVSTYQEHADDGDPEVETPQRFFRRKSIVSAESGIKTDTEDSVRSRMEDSGNEKETDYSEGESASDDLSSTCFMQTALSPLGIHLNGSSHSISANASSVSSPRTPLTPKERKVITPLRPASTSLSVSEVSNKKRELEEEDTDIENAIAYSHTVPSLSRNSSARQSGRRGSDSENSRVSSSSSGSKWYKSSTASDTERERSRANRAYHAPHSESLQYPLPPNYHPPPPQPKDQTPIAYPNTRRSRVPIHITDSALSRNASKYESYQFSYMDVPVRDPRLGYDNHRLQQQHHVLPKDNHNPPNGSSLTSKRSKNASAYPTQRQQSLTSTSYSRPYHNPGPGSALPAHSLFNHSISYGNEDKTKREPEQRFQDLKSVSTINPIAYWEMQDRIKTVVDQVDPYQILSEPYIQFEDVSTDPSVIESQITQEQEHQEHQSFSSQGGGEDAANAVDQMNLSLSQLQEDVDSTVVTETVEPDAGPRPIFHFPSADCSSQYTPTLVDSSSGSLTPKTPNVFALSHSQYQFDV